MQGAYYSSSDIFVIFTIVITIFTFLVPNVSQLMLSNVNILNPHTWVLFYYSYFTGEATKA